MSKLDIIVPTSITSAVFALVLSGAVYWNLSGRIEAQSAVMNESSPVVVLRPRQNLEQLYTKPLEEMTPEEVTEGLDSLSEIAEELSQSGYIVLQDSQTMAYPTRLEIDLSNWRRNP